MAERPGFGVGAHGLTSAARVRAPIRSGVVAVIGLALVSVFSFPSPGGARVDPPFELQAAVLTSDGTDGYEFVTDARSAAVTAPLRNTGSNLRTVFWSRAAQPQRDAHSCATWSDATSDLVQQGAAVRISSTSSGSVRAVTVTKNVYMHGYWIFNVHVWDNATNIMRRITSVNLQDAFMDPQTTTWPLPNPVPLPWRLCTRITGLTLEFKAWRLAEPEPEWGDRARGATVSLPVDTPGEGFSGWYVGHLGPGMTATFTDLSTDDAGPPTR